MKLFLIAVSVLLLILTSSAAAQVFTAESYDWLDYPDGYWKLVDAKVTPSYQEGVESNVADAEASSTAQVKCHGLDEVTNTGTTYFATGSSYIKQTTFPSQAEDMSDFTVAITAGLSNTCEPGDDASTQLSSIVPNYSNGWIVLYFLANSYAYGHSMSNGISSRGEISLPESSWGSESTQSYTYKFPSFYSVWLHMRAREQRPANEESDKYAELLVEATIPNKYFFEHVIILGTYGGYANVTYKYVWVPRGARATFTGRVMDYDRRPLAYAKIELSYDGNWYTSVAAADGVYSIDVPTFDMASQNEVALRAVLDYKRDSKTYFVIVESGWLTYLQKSFIPDGPEDFVQDFDFGFAFKGDYDKDVSEQTGEDGIAYLSRSNFGKLRDAAAIYYNVHEAADFYLTILQADLTNKLPVSFFINSNEWSMFKPSSSNILICKQHTPYYSIRRRFTEQHEFSHYAMFSQYRDWPDGRYLPNTTNHDGYINPSTADSFIEGFAEFMPLAIASHTNKPRPDVYRDRGSMENNYKAWMFKGRAEEYAVASLLWDLYDTRNDRGDTISLTIQQIWSVLKTKRKDFKEYYQAFVDAFPDKKAQIDAVFIEHGFFADKNPGNGARDLPEPFRDGNRNGGYDQGEYFVDYGMTGSKTAMWYDQGEEVGRATTYNRTNRGLDGDFPDAFLKVSDTGAELYTVSVHFGDPQDGEDYEYSVDRIQGKIYLMPLPEDVDATITVRPSQGYTAQNTYTITNEEYISNYYASEGKGYSDEHTFGLSGAGPAEKYWTEDFEQEFVPDGGYNGTGSTEVNYDELPGAPAGGAASGAPSSGGASQVPSAAPPGAQPSAGGDSGFSMILIILVAVLAVVVLLILVMMKKPRGSKPATQYVSTTSPITPAAPPRFCQFCGQRVEEGDVLCPKCGAAQARR